LFKKKKELNKKKKKLFHTGERNSIIKELSNKKFSIYKNHKLSLPKSGISLPSKWGNISATVSGYLIVI
jgi:hypothetical protein